MTFRYRCGECEHVWETKETDPRCPNCKEYSLIFRTHTVEDEEDEGYLVNGC
jgi:rubrerythrin